MERMTLPHQNDSTCVTLLGTATWGARKARPSLTHGQLFRCPLNWSYRWFLCFLYIVEGYRLAIQAFPWWYSMASPRSPTSCTRKLIEVDWFIRCLIFNPKLLTLGRWASLHFNPLGGGTAFKGMGQAGRTTLCLLRCPQSRQAIWFWGWCNRYF